MSITKLFNIELYYSPAVNISDGIIKLTDEEYKHSFKVMRNTVGKSIYITNGTGEIFKSEIASADRNELYAKITETIKSDNKFKHIHFCIPKLKNPDRFKFALEKSIELGITNFIVFESERTVAKGTNISRWQKIALSAMKQSLRAYLPEIKTAKSVTHIVELKGKKIVFEQNSEKRFRNEKFKNENYYLIFGPEGGLTENELQMFSPESQYSLSDHRLRSETAIVRAAALVNN